MPSRTAASSAGSADTLSGGLDSCGHAVGVGEVAVMVPYVLLMVCGGLSRSAPTGGCANGIPLKLSTRPDLEPTTVPFRILTTGPWMLGGSAKHPAVVVVAAVAAIKNTTTKNATIFLSRSTSPDFYLPARTGDSASIYHIIFSPPAISIP